MSVKQRFIFVSPLDELNDCEWGNSKNRNFGLRHLQMLRNNYNIVFFQEISNDFQENSKKNKFGNNYVGETGIFKFAKKISQLRISRALWKGPCQ